MMDDALQLSIMDEMFERNYTRVEDDSIPKQLYVVYIFFALALLVAFLDQYLCVEIRRLREIFCLVSSSRRAYEGTHEGTHERTHEGAVECPMCLEQLKQGDEVVKLPCGHVFRSSCIEKWLLYTSFQQRTCPVCRQTPLVSDTEVEQIEKEQQWEQHMREENQREEQRYSQREEQRYSQREEQRYSRDAWVDPWVLSRVPAPGMPYMM